MKPEFLKSRKKKEILEQLNQQYSIKELPYLLIQSGKEKIRGFTGSLSKEELLQLSRELNIEAIGIYLAKQEKDGLRLSFDAPFLLKPEKNIIEISNERAEEWLKGRDIEFADKSLSGFVVLKNKENFLGCGKVSQGRIANFVPKERRVKGWFFLGVEDI